MFRILNLHITYSNGFMKQELVLVFVTDENTGTQGSSVTAQGHTATVNENWHFLQAVWEAVGSGWLSSGWRRTTRPLSD